MPEEPEISPHHRLIPAVSSGSNLAPPLDLPNLVAVAPPQPSPSLVIGFVHMGDRDHPYPFSISIWRRVKLRRRGEKESQMATFKYFAVAVPMVCEQ
ncbi:hypothetical protein TIFTF001_000371 [Ficus carica]|uniref:Uncharacterized protein n=1 Tax=Ficus carica TaxID=3494 RepID=A0AA88CP01_FICCA|nr:hypothetical protein TIFTF001_000371 [Ficus carica]